jgi:hypothetical protein
LNSRTLFVYRFISARHNGASASAHRSNLTDALRNAASGHACYRNDNDCEDGVVSLAFLLRHESVSRCLKSKSGESNEIGFGENRDVSGAGCSGVIGGDAVVIGKGRRLLLQLGDRWIELQLHDDGAMPDDGRRARRVVLAPCRLEFVERGAWQCRPERLLCLLFEGAQTQTRAGSGRLAGGF